MSITTFDDLAANPTSQKDFLVIMTPKMRLQNWTKTAGYTNVYEKIFANIFEVSSEFGNTYRKVSSVEHNGTQLTAQASIADVDTNPGSYWHDETNSKLYVHLTDSTSPNYASKWIVVFFNLYFSSGVGKNGRGKIFNNIYYEPLFSASNFPTLHSEQTDILMGGGLKTGSANFEFHNSHRFWNKIWTNFNWKNAIVKAYYGGEDLPFSEYQLIYFGYNRNEIWEESRVRFETVNFIDLLKRNIPVNPVFETNVAAEDRGKPWPLLIGAKSGITPFLIDKSDDANRIYSIADPAYQTLKSIDAVYDGTTDVTTQVTKDLANCRFQFNNYTPTGKVTCDAQGAKISDIPGESSTDLMTNASDILRFFLKKILQLSDAYIDSGAFATAKVACTFPLGKYIRFRRNLSSYIEEIERSVFGRFEFNTNGKFAFHIYEPKTTEDDELRDEEMGAFEQRGLISKIFRGIRIHYNPTPYERDEASSITEGEDDTYQIVQGENESSRYLDGQTSAYKSIYTWITSESDAQTHLQRLLLLTSAQPIEIEVEALGIKMFRRKPGDIMKIYRKKGATSTGKIDGLTYQIVKLENEITGNRSRLLLDNFKGLGVYVGIWAAADAPNWQNSTKEQKDQQGYWADPNGYIDPNDGASYNKSVWW